MSHIRIKMRSGASTAFPQSTTVAKEAGVGRSLGLRSIMEGPIVPTSVFCTSRFEGRNIVSGSWLFKDPLIGYRDV
jgi:hypothetical protein